MFLKAISTMTLTLAMVVMPLAAQDGRPDRGERGARGERTRTQAPTRLTAEQTKTAWTLQAVGVAKGLELDADTTQKLVETYLASRKEHEEALAEFRRGSRERGPREGRGEAGERPGRGEAGERPGRGEGRGAGRGQGRGGAQQQQMRELTDKYRMKLEKSLGSYVEGEKLKSAVFALGTFNTSWDRMVATLAGFELEEAKTHEALAPIQKYVVELAEMRSGDNPRGMREDMREAREDLSYKMKKMLTDEQMRRFERAMGGQRGFGGPGGGSMAERLMQFDENADGKLSKDEVPERMAQMFDRLDENGDGFIDKKEMEAFGGRSGRGGRGGGRGFGGGDDF